MSSKAIGALADDTAELWTSQCINLSQIIQYFRTNDVSGLSPEAQLVVNTIRDMCIETSPVDVNVTKRFDSDENLIKHYQRLSREVGKNTVSPDNIFQPSFVYTVLPSYAQKFYNRGALTVGVDAVAEAAKHLSLAVKYQVAQAVTTNTPIPLPFGQQLGDDYMKLLLRQSDIPANIQKAVNSRKYPQLNNINDLINNVIDGLFAGGGDYYNYVLNETNRARIASLRDNVAFLARNLSTSTNIFEYIAQLATQAGKKPNMFQDAAFMAATVSRKKPRVQENECRRTATELAFQNEALRRFIFQQLSYK